MNSFEIFSPEINKFSCRACLGNELICNSLFDVVNCNNENIELRELYKFITKIEISYDEAKPTNICETCTEKLLAAYEFVLNVERNEELLGTYVIQPNNHFENENEILSSEEKSVEIVRDIDPGEDDVGSVVVNEIELKIENDLEDFTDETTEADVGKQNDEFEILDEFEYMLQRDSVGTNHEGEVNPESNKTEQNLRKHQGKKPKDAIGSRLSSRNENKSQRFNCTLCQRSFAKLRTYERHIEIAHTYAPREEIAAKQIIEPSIQCPSCPRTFMHKNDLQRHMVALHSLKNETENENEKQKPTAEKQMKRKYNRGLCPHCGQDFPVSSLIIHIRRHLGEKPYKCDQCEKGFPRKQDLDIHQRQHSGEKPHVCTVCGKAFIRPNKLSRHMRIHLGIRPYKCNECGKCFSQSNDLKIHMRRHSGEKPYVCGICSESFISGTALKAHRKAKSHFEPELQAVDPYANCRVNTRPQTILKKQIDK